MNLSTIEQGEELLKKATPGPWGKTDQEGEIGSEASKYYYVVSIGMEGDGGFLLEHDRDMVIWLFNHASELLQMARERHNLMQYVIDLAADHGYKDFAAYLNKLDRGENA